MFLEDAMVVSCGHSFGGQMLKKIIEMVRYHFNARHVFISAQMFNKKIKVGKDISEN